MKSNISISLDSELIVQLHQLSRERGTNVSRIVGEAVRAHLERFHRDRKRAGRVATLTHSDQQIESDSKMSR